MTNPAASAAAPASTAVCAVPADAAAASPNTTGATIQVTVNGDPRRVTPSSLADWVAREGLVAEAVATAINGDFVPRGTRADVVLRDGDRLDVFRAIVGG